MNIWYVRVVRSMSTQVVKYENYLHVVGDINDIRADMESRGYTVTHAVPTLFKE